MAKNDSMSSARPATESDSRRETLAGIAQMAKLARGLTVRLGLPIVDQRGAVEHIANGIPQEVLQQLGLASTMALTPVSVRESVAALTCLKTRIECPLETGA